MSQLPPASPSAATPPEETSLSLTARRKRATRRVFLRLCGMALAGVLAVPVEAHYVEPLAVQITLHDVYLPDLPAEQDGLVLAHLSDLHRGQITPDHVIRQAIQIAKQHNPDIAVVTGDFVDQDPADALPLATMLAELSPRLGLWGCLGNHDYADETGDTVTSAMAAGARLKMLRNEAQEIVPGFWIAGVEDSLRGRPDSARALAPVPPDAAAVILAHVPSQVYSLTQKPGLVLSGHTHGGQVRIPGMAPHMPPGVEGFPVTAGWGTFDKTRLFVSRGVGMTGLALRFRCRPEVAIIRLYRGEQPPYTHPNLPTRAIKKVARAARSAWHGINQDA